MQAMPINSNSKDKDNLKPMIALKYPNLRLKVLDEIYTCKASCFQAIVNVSAQSGLIKGAPESATSSTDSAHCQAIQAAFYVIEIFMFERFPTCPDNQNSIDKLHDTLKENVDYFISNPDSYSCPIVTGNPFDDCNHIAPIVIDLLVQLLLPYSK